MALILFHSFGPHLRYQKMSSRDQCAIPLNRIWCWPKLMKVFPTGRPKATGWGPTIPRRVLSATTSAAPTSPTSAWRTAARRSLRSCSSSLTPCAPWSWTPSTRRTRCPWRPSLEDANIAISTLACLWFYFILFYFFWQMLDYSLTFCENGKKKCHVLSSFFKKYLIQITCSSQAWHFTSYLCSTTIIQLWLLVFRALPVPTALELCSFHPVISTFLTLQHKSPTVLSAKNSENPAMQAVNDMSDQHSVRTLSESRCDVCLASLICTHSSVHILWSFTWQWSRVAFYGKQQGIRSPLIRSEWVHKLSL